MIVTGAASGIGRATAVALADVGMTVLAADVSESGLRHLRESRPSIETIPGDIVSEDVVAEIAERARLRGGPDVLVNSAGVMMGGDILTLEVSDWDRVFQVNVRAPLLLSKAVLPSMLSQGDGVIVNVSSVMAERAEPGSGAYSASKAALLALTREIAVSYASRGVRCVAVCPGWVDTPMNSAAAEELGADELASYVRRQQPLGRMLTADEIAAVIVFLVSPAASGLAGAALAVDGGMGAYLSPCS